MQLTTTDLHLLLDLVGVLHTSSIHDLLERCDVTRKLSELLHVDVIGQTVWSDHGRRLERANGWGRDEGMAADYKRHFHAMDPISPLLRGGPEPKVIETLIDRRRLRRSQYFADFLAVYKAYPGVHMYLQDADGTLFDHRFGSSDPKKRFGNREVCLLNLLRPHLINAHRLQQVVRTLSEETGLTDSCPSFTLEALKDPRPNCKARTLMARLTQGERDALYRVLALVPGGASTALQWNGFSLCIEHAGRAGGNRPVYVVHLLAHTVGSGAWLQQRFDLTLREGEICHLMLKGLADKQIAAILKISYWTVRIHAGRILEKLAIDSRAGIGLAVLKASHNTTIDKDDLPDM